MPEAKNPRVHAPILPALASVVGPTNKILAIGSVTAKGTPEAIAPDLPHEVRATVRANDLVSSKVTPGVFSGT